MELQRLLTTLSALPPAGWRDAALSALRQPNVVFAGRSGAKATSTAKDFADLYQSRFEHARENNVEVSGIEDFLAALKQQPAGAQIRGEPFLGPTSTVYAFWAEGNVLIGCLTMPNTDSGEASYQLATGKSA